MSNTTKLIHKHLDQLNTNQDKILKTSNNITFPIIGDYYFKAESPLEYFHLIDPLAENPNIALLSVSILLLFIGLQCLNFIIIIFLLFKYQNKILSYFDKNLKLKSYLNNFFSYLIKLINLIFILFLLLFILFL
jgi:type IV secretory pathway TrbL component